jgi:rubrerythrin
MNDLITEIKNKLYANEPVDKDEIEELLSYISDDTIWRLETLHEQTGLDYEKLITIAVTVMNEQWAMSDNKNHTKLEEIPEYKEYSAWCHDCGRPFIYYTTAMDEPDYECPRCNSSEYVTVP